MFIQYKVVYVIKEFAGDVVKITNDLIQNNILKRYFDDDSVIEDKNFLRFISSLPQNTVFCVDLVYNDNYIKQEDNIINIAIPFISSHINFPVKIGETVWFYRYNLNNKKFNSVEKYNINGYYLGRVHSLLNTEDTSYCFNEREISYFSPSRLDINDGIKSEQKGILGIENNKKEILSLNNNLIHNPDTEVKSIISNKLLNNEYYTSELKKYRLRPSCDSIINHEDLVLRGTHNTSIELGSDYYNVKKSLSENDSTFRDPASGKISIIAGINEKLKNKSFNSTKKISFISDENIIDDDGKKLILYGNNISPDVDNGLFYETVKSIQQFKNPDKVDNNIRTSLGIKKQYNIKNNSSSLIVSESSSESKIIKNNIKFTIPHIDNFVEPVLLPKNTLERPPLSNDYVSFIPNNRPISNYSQNKMSSITSISDDITFSLHKDSQGSITLLNPVSNDNFSSYLMLTNEGNIHLNGQKIVIGDYNRLPDTQNGYNASVYLGYSNEMNSLVLGEQLNAFLEEILFVQKTSLYLIKDLFIQSKEINKITKESFDGLLNGLNSFSISLSGTPISGQGSTLLTEVSKSMSSFAKLNIDAYQTQIDNFKASKEEDLFKRLENIEKNLDKLLSKFVKTS